MHRNQTSALLKIELPVLREIEAIKGRVEFYRTTDIRSWDREDCYNELREFRSSYKSRGLPNTLSKLKEIRTYIQRTGMGLPAEYPGWVKAVKSNSPILLPFKKTMRLALTGVEGQKKVNTVLSELDHIKINPSYDVSNITRKASYDPIFLDTLCQEGLSWSKGLPSFKKVPFTEFERLTRMGPRGPRILSAPWDLLTIRQKYPEVATLIGMVYSDFDFTNVTECKPSPEWRRYSDKNKDILGGIAFLPEKAGKTRVVAKIDYWTQLSLTPIHDHLASILSRTPRDATKDQKKTGRAIKAQLHSGGFVGTLDLSAATDRFPRIFTLKILEGIFGPDVTQLWEKIRTREFLVPQGKEEPLVVKYEVGQPRGCRSSFNSFALSRHSLIQVIAARKGKPGFTDYVLLGDDVSIFDESIYRETLDALVKCGVKVNVHKCTASHSTAEMAKRIYVKTTSGDVIDVSGVPTRMGIETKTRPSRLGEFLLKLIERDYPIDYSVKVVTRIWKVYHSGTYPFLPSTWCYLPKGVDKDVAQCIKDETLSLIPEFHRELLSDPLFYEQGIKQFLARKIIEVVEKHPSWPKRVEIVTSIPNVKSHVTTPAISVGGRLYAVKPIMPEQSPLVYVASSYVRKAIELNYDDVLEYGHLYDRQQWLAFFDAKIWLQRDAASVSSTRASVINYAYKFAYDAQIEKKFIDRDYYLELVEQAQNLPMVLSSIAMDKGTIWAANHPRWVCYGGVGDAISNDASRPVAPSLAKRVPEPGQGLKGNKDVTKTTHVGTADGDLNRKVEDLKRLILRLIGQGKAKVPKRSNRNKGISGPAKKDNSSRPVNPKGFTVR